MSTSRSNHIAQQFSVHKRPSIEPSHQGEWIVIGLSQEDEWILAHLSQQRQLIAVAVSQGNSWSFDDLHFSDSIQKIEKRSKSSRLRCPWERLSSPSHAKGPNERLPFLFLMWCTKSTNIFLVCRALDHFRGLSTPNPYPSPFSAMYFQPRYPRPVMRPAAMLPRRLPSRLPDLLNLWGRFPVKKEARIRNPGKFVFITSLLPTPVFTANLPPHFPNCPSLICCHLDK
jgi:hypothetical protein